MKRILVLCTGNSCRSQMAEGYLRHFAGGKAEVFSAGIEAHGLNPMAVRSMHADGVDISGQTSNTMDEYRSVSFDFIITVCDNAREHCPVFPGDGRRFHQDFPDPSHSKGTPGEVEAAFASVRDQIKKYIRQFVLDHLN